MYLPLITLLTPLLTFDATLSQVRAAVLALRPSNAAQAALAQNSRAELALRLSEVGALVELDTSGSIGKRYRRQDEVRPGNFYGGPCANIYACVGGHAILHHSRLRLFYKHQRHRQCGWSANSDGAIQGHYGAS